MKPGIVSDLHRNIDGLGFRLRVTFDVGGTFADKLAYDSGGAMGKALTCTKAMTCCNTMMWGAALRG